jgi:hypothetical protein
MNDLNQGESEFDLKGKFPLMINKYLPCKDPFLKQFGFDQRDVSSGKRSQK